MDVRPINANSLHKVISEWPEPVMYKDWVQSAIAYEPTIPVTVPTSPCASCGYHGEHLDAPPCTNCPAHPKQASTNQPQPLLLSRLQRMDGKPIWYVDLKTGHCEWCILRVIHPNLAIFIDDLPALGQVPHIENALAMSSKINVRFCMTAEHMSEVAAAYPATHIKIIENCKVFF